MAETTQHQSLENLDLWNNAIPLGNGSFVRFDETLVERGNGAGAADILRGTVIGQDGTEGNRVLTKAFKLPVFGVHLSGEKRTFSKEARRVYDDINDEYLYLQTLNQYGIRPLLHNPAYIEPPEDVLQQTGRIYLLMEEIPGKDLATLQREGNTFSQNQAVRIIDDVLETLQIAEDVAIAPKVIIHRDVSRQNIVIDRKTEEGVLLDWNLALQNTEVLHLTNLEYTSGQVIGKQAYAPPRTVSTTIHSRK